jgi:ssRNA-specific RNase YbeY (16S rRNA maturation enzyme)
MLNKMPEQPIDICIEITCQGEIASGDIERLEKLIRDILDQFGVDSAEINVSIVDDDGIIDVNQRCY